MSPVFVELGGLDVVYGTLAKPLGLKILLHGHKKQQESDFLPPAQRRGQVVLLWNFFSFFRLLALVSFCCFFTSATMI